MQLEREISALTVSPSFRESPAADAVAEDYRPSSVTSEGSPHWIPAVPRPVEREQPEVEEEGDEEESIDDFEFSIVVRDPEGGPGITADEIFSDGQIRPIYPVFNRDLLADAGDGRDAAEEEKEDKAASRLPLRRLLIEEREACSRSGSVSSSSSSSMDDLEAIPPGTYCVWAPRSVPPSPDRCKKSSSTGSSLRWRIRDLVVGRSHSDGKEKFVFLAAEEKGKKPNPSPSPIRETKAKGSASSVPAAATAEDGKKGKGKGKGAKVTELDMVTAHRLYYSKNIAGGTGAGQGAKVGRRSFLPYKQDLVGLFANVNGLSRTHHPF